MIIRNFFMMYLLVYVLYYKSFWTDIYYLNRDIMKT